MSLNIPFPQKQIPLKWLIGFLILLLFIILAVGLQPRGFRLANKVKWIKEQAGIRFSKYSIAYTHPWADMILSQKSDTHGFSIVIALKPEKYRGSRFQFILALHNGNDSKQLVMGQWRSWFIVMNGDDYAYRRKIKRISVDAANPASTSPQARLITITTTNDDGTKIYFDGNLVRTQKDLTLKIPPGGDTRLLVGNSVYGRHPWQGEIYGLAIYRYPLSSQKAAIHFDRWAENKTFEFAIDDRPSLLYLFDEMGDIKAMDHSGGNHHLQIPPRMHVLKTEILAPPWKHFKLNRMFGIDIIINLFGFMPFGFILYAIFIRLGGAFEKQGVLITVAICFSISFALEIVQGWIPSRSSHMLDLLLNTLGGWMGALSCMFFAKIQGFNN